MSDEKGEQRSAYEIGAETLQKVYAGTVPLPPEGSSAFLDVMLKTIFSEVWTRDILSIRDRRLLLMGAIAANSQADVWSVQGRAALELGELTPEQLRETMVMLAPYVGYPNVVPLVAECEKVIEAWETDQGKAPQSS